MVRLLDKEREMGLLDGLFDLMRDNMAEVVPAGLTNEWEKAKWLAEVVPALKKTPARLCCCIAKVRWQDSACTISTAGCSWLRNFRSGGDFAAAV